MQAVRAEHNPSLRPGMGIANPRDPELELPFKIIGVDFVVYHSQIMMTPLRAKYHSAFLGTRKKPKYFLYHHCFTQYTDLDAKRSSLFIALGWMYF